MALTFPFPRHNFVTWFPVRLHSGRNFGHWTGTPDWNIEMETFYKYERRPLNYMNIRVYTIMTIAARYTNTI